MQIQARAARDALADAGLDWKDVDGLLVAGSWGLPGPGGMLALAMAEYLNLRPRYLDSTNAGGSSFEMHVGHAAMALASGACDVALILYGSDQRSGGRRSLGGRPNWFNLQFETP